MSDSNIQQPHIIIGDGNPNSARISSEGSDQTLNGHQHQNLFSNANGHNNRIGEDNAYREDKVERSDGGEKGDDGEDESKKPVGFWHPSLKKTRTAVFGLWFRTTIILSLFILTVLSLYWAVFFHVIQNTPSLIVWIVDFDAQVAPYTSVKPLLGPMVTQMTEQMVAEDVPEHLGYVTVPASQFNYDPMQVREAVWQQDCWAAILVNANATALLQSSVETGNASYDPLGAMQFIYEDARDQETFYDYLYPGLSKLQTEITSKFGEQWTMQVLSNTSISRANLQKVPQALSPAVGFSTFNLRPFIYETTPAVTVGLIYLIIIAFFSFTFFLPVHMKYVSPDEGHPPLKFAQLIIWRWISTIVAYLIMSLSYSFVSLAFQIPFTNAPTSHTVVGDSPNAFGHGTFAVYWMINFVGMIALGLACENVAMIIGNPWTAFWLIFWVITNVSTSFYPIELEPRFFYWGYAWPLHNIVEATRTTLYDLHSRLGLNFGILFAWAAVNSLVFPAACWFMRWKTQKEKKKAEEKKEQ
ncbi:hypothetical protein MMC25_006280 [Agyrium rufum]|nr:hypothetical protein [Agyrium rufum]